MYDVMMGVGSSAGTEIFTVLTSTKPVTAEESHDEKNNQQTKTNNNLIDSLTFHIDSCQLSPNQ